MDTPEADRRATDSPSLQDSPFFSYISSLSPIEPIDAGKASLGGLTFPSPQHVFTSPHMNLPRKTNLLRRTQKPTLFGSENFAAGLADDARPHIEAAEVSRLSASLPVVQLIPCTQKERDSHDSSQDHSSSSHSCCIDEFLADPAGDSDNPSASPSLCLMRAVELLWSTQGNNSNANEEVKKSDKEDHADVQHCTTSDFAEKPMSDPEGFTATVLPDAHVNKLMDLAQALEGEYIMLKEAFVEIHDPKSEKRKGSSTSLNLRPLFQAENDLLGKDTSSPKEPVESEGNLKIFDDAMEISRPSHNEQLEPLAPDHVSVVSKDVGIVEHIKDGSAINFCCHGSEDVKVHLSKGGQWQESCCTCHLQPEPIQNVKLDRNPHDDTGTKHNTSGENQNPYEQEENMQHQRVMCKRLQFEAVETHSLSIGRDENSTIGSDLEPPETLLDSENPYSTHAESVATSSSTQTNILVNHSGNAPGRLPQCSNGTPESPACMVDWPVVANGDSSMIAPRPFGIGLHLNSIGSASPMKCNTKMQSLELDMTVKGKILLPGNKASSGPKNCPASTSLKKYHSVKLTTTSEKQMPCSAAENSEEKLLNSSLHYHSVFDAKPLNSSPHSDLIDSYMTPCNMNRLPADSSRSGESNQSIPRKKRKVASDNDGCKRCSCKRSKCLKLYCDCFAAGAYCTEDCACQECFNRPEYQDMVLGTRQQIESRNPLAFAPKVVIRVTESPKDHRDSKHITSTSARHKRGCSCKKSLCLKKYCECYQAGVGCSIGCRCEGCKNTYGRKDGFGDISELEHKISQKGTEHKKSMEGVCYQASSDQKVEEMEVRSETINAKLCHSRFSPLTPLLRVSSENDASKFLLLASYYPSPESSAPLLPSFLESPSSPRILLSSSTSTEVREGSSSQVLYDQEPECHAAAKVDSFSPRWDWFPDIHSLSPLPNPSPIASGTSSDSKKQECNILQTKLFQESGCSSGGTLHLHSSPITPLPCFGEGKFVFEPDSASEQHDIVEDDTPDVLKDNLPPIKAVKETSPNQKRVCSPHKLLHPGCSTISPGVKSGHKFILQSVPSFPPLTPCSNNAGEDAHKIGTG